MCGEGCWKGVTVFCLAFGLSVFIANSFEAKIIQLPVAPLQFNELNNSQVIRPIDPKELNKNSISKPICKKYAKNEISEIRKEHIRINKFLDSNKNISPKDKENYQKKIAEIEKKVLDILEKPVRKPRVSSRESKPIHNLLFVKNCEEY